MKVPVIDPEGTGFGRYRVETQPCLSPIIELRAKCLEMAMRSAGEISIKDAFAAEAIDRVFFRADRLFDWITKEEEPKEEER